MIALGVDAATKTGWALVKQENHREVLLDWGVLDFKKHEIDPWNPAALLALRCRPPAPMPNIVAIEMPYLGQNVSTLTTLAIICGRFAQAMGPSGADIRFVRACEWQPKMIGPTRLGRDKLKNLAVAWCRSNFRVTLPQDAADGAVIAVHALRFPS